MTDPKKRSTEVDRRSWLEDRRRATEERFDTTYAPTYDQDDIPITPTGHIAVMCQRA